MVEAEKQRKMQQVIDICNECGYDRIDDWTVFTTLTPSDRFYTRFSHVNCSTYFKTLKAVRAETERLVAEEAVERRRVIRRARHARAEAPEIEPAPEIAPELEIEPAPEIAAIAHEIDELHIQDSDEFCGICLSACDKEISLKCGHSYCGDCLGAYLVNSDAESLFDHTYALVYCPTCKNEDKHNHITHDIMQYCLELGVIDEQCITRLNAMTKQFISTDIIYSCITEGCQGRWMIDDEPFRNGNKFEISCPVCEVAQCCNCQVRWTAGHKCIDNTVDEETREYIQSISVVCPGKCGDSLEKDDNGIISCNVLRCHKDRLYVCGLCGDQLDSSEFDPSDTDHNRASKHFFFGEPGPACCKGQLFTSRAEWLKKQKKE